MFTFVNRLPCAEGLNVHLPVQVHEIAPTRRFLKGRSRIWQDDVVPLIRSLPNRPDRDWNWAKVIPILLFFGGRRGPRMFQMTIGDDERPAAMIALLEEERWPLNHGETATFVWFLSTAPSSFLSHHRSDGSTLTPKMVGQAALDVAVTTALNGRCDGRLWLHADPAGGSALRDWYVKTVGMTTIDPVAYPILPGVDQTVRFRRNDGRYLALDRAAALKAYNALSHYRGIV